MSKYRSALLAVLALFLSVPASAASLKISNFTSGEIQYKVGDKTVSILPGMDPMPEIPAGAEVKVVSGNASFAYGDGNTVSAGAGATFDFNTKTEGGKEVVSIVNKSETATVTASNKSGVAVLQPKGSVDTAADGSSVKATGGDVSVIVAQALTTEQKGKAKETVAETIIGKLFIYEFSLPPLPSTLLKDEKTEEEEEITGIVSPSAPGR